MTKTFKIGIFDDEEKFLSSIRSLKEQKFSIHDVFTPYPVHEVFHLLKRKSRLPTAAYFFGLFRYSLSPVSLTIGLPSIK